jgi:hypothetical protein
MKKKQELGQFYTTNAEYIIGNLFKDLPENISIVDPFAGNWDLLSLAEKKLSINNIHAYDLDPQNLDTIQQDTLLNPPDYKGLYVITNPPYLARNKTKDQAIFEKYDVFDLYKAAIETFMGCEGGILIVPLNFLCDDRSVKTRKRFLSKYGMQSLNIFEEQVFEDTQSTICSFSFLKNGNTSQIVKPHFYPNDTECQYVIEKEHGYVIGGCFLDEIRSNKSSVHINRLTAELKAGYHISNIKLYATDSGAKDGMIRLEKDTIPFYGKETDRTFATIISDCKLDDVEDVVIYGFNQLLNWGRLQYHSLFLTNYRHSTKECARKRISFGLAFDIISYILKTKCRM